MNWSNVDLKDAYQRDQNIVDPMSFNYLLEIIECNVTYINEDTIRQQFENDLKSKIESAREIFEANLQNIKADALEYRNLDNPADKYEDIGLPLIDLNHSQRWEQGLKELRNGSLVEMTVEAYDYFLETLPPMRMDGSAYVSCEPYTHNGQGEAVYLCAHKQAGKYVAQHGTIRQFAGRQLFKGEPVKY